MRKVSQEFSTSAVTIPKKQSLVYQTKQSILESIQTGVFVDRLPGEYSLQKLLHVSRATIRSAIELLKSDGVLKSANGKRHLICKQPRTLRKLYPKMIQTVALLSSKSVETLDHEAIRVIDALREHFHDLGYSLHVLHDPRLLYQKPDYLLENYRKEIKAACWILYSAPAKVQHWFHAHNIPHIIFGTAWKQTGLFSVDINFPEICSHFVGKALAYRHRSIGLLGFDSGFAGDKLTEQSFEEAVAKAKMHTSISATIARHDSSRESVIRKLDFLCGTTPRITALLISYVEPVITAFCYLGRSRIPDPFSIVARDFNPVFTSLYPTLSYYHITAESFVIPIAHAVDKILNEGITSGRAKLISPQWVPGNSFIQLG